MRPEDSSLSLQPIQSNFSAHHTLTAHFSDFILRPALSCKWFLFSEILVSHMHQETKRMKNEIHKAPHYVIF